MVQRGFDGAGVGWALFHPSSGFREGRDLDIAVDRPCRDVIELLDYEMAGAGYVRAVEAEWDIPDAVCTWYLREEPGGSFSNATIDLTFDPEGIGTIGVPTSAIIDSASRMDGLPHPTPAWEAAYKLSKQLGKGRWNREALKPVVDLACIDEAAFARVASHVFGPRKGRMLARRLSQGPLVTSEREAAGLRRAVLVRRLAHARMPWRIPVMNARRVWHRARRPSGRYIVISGPDGAGKSTLSRTLAELGRSKAFRTATILHWRPGLLPRAGALVGQRVEETSTPHESEPRGKLNSLARLGFYWIDYALGYWLRIWPLVARQGLVIVERGYWDMLVDQRRYRLDAPEWLMRALGRLVPAPHAAIILSGDPDILAARKPEIAHDEIVRQTEMWRALARRRGMHVVDASLPFDEVVSRASAVMIRTRSDPVRHPYGNATGKGAVSG